MISAAMSQEPDSPLAEHSGSESDNEACSTALPVVNLLSEEGEELRRKLKAHLENEMFDEESILRIVKPYGPNIVQTVLPTFLGGLIERKTKQQRTAEKIKAAVLGLEQHHQFCFKWNRMYEDFLKGRPSEVKQTEKGVEYVRSVLGEDYKTFLGLPLGRDSNIRLLRPICKLMELLAMTKEDLRVYVLKVKDNRCAALAGTQGHRQTVTIEDLEVVKNALTRLKWLPPPAAPKRPREKTDDEEEQTGDALKKRQKKSGRESQKSKEGSRGKRGKDVVEANEELEEDANGSRSANQGCRGRGTGDDEYESPSQDMTKLILPTPPQRRDYTPTPREKTPPPGFPEVSKGARERTAKKVPKNAKDLWSYRVLGAGALSGLVRFGDWLDSDYVHGNGGEGEFAFDNAQAGSIYASRLIGFHDAYKHHLGRDYLNSWIVLPLGDPAALSTLWTSVSEMLNHRALSLDDAALVRLKRDSVECRRVLYPNDLSRLDKGVGGPIQSVE
ncbi:hypothetical protein QFC22_006765 [Naganishia vaughanmartiniae]|uniref:Uncharacterized protein n=1 Tax=Naganishia vaughanmartiniae TaxID=1424756 RepID=A0ACC2WEX4_9TREE|nr:hypothetical protein QFC22_006765 [Naganishia vaughanmartiniae]